MKNDLIEARLRRDHALSAFLTEQKSRYGDAETDVAPLRQQLSQALTEAQNIAQDVLTADNDGNSPRKRGTRNQLTQLLRRLVVALQAEAAAAGDQRLRALAGRPGQLGRLNESTFIEEARRLLSLAPERSTALAKRRFAPEHYQQAQSLLSELRRSANEGRLNDVAGSTGRQALERLIKQNARTIEQVRTFLRTYEQDEPALWQEFQAAARVVKRGGPDGPSPAAPGNGDDGETGGPRP
ncbi:hypothetical protein [Hymenobacter sp. B81]|uniref:hypothetical protein n=1 Tax=Hymenobacter sp. B81 TaxID=3344878 RepID=UPI0037DD0435